MAGEQKCAFCGGAIAYEPYWETMGGTKLPFHAKACADSYKVKKADATMTRCALCGGAIAFAPYYETIDGKKLAFHAKACADAYKTTK